MASGKDPEPKVKGTFGVRRPPGDPVRKQGEYLRKVWTHFGTKLVEYYTDDRVKIEFIKKYPPPYVAASKESANHRITAAEELSLEICEMLTHLHVVPSPDHIQKVFNDNQFDIFRHMIRCMMIHYTTNNT